MPYLSNAAINRLNIHMGLHMLASGLGGGFFLVFLMSRGLTLAQTFLCFIALLAARFVLRPLVLLTGPRLGYKYSLLAGVGFYILQYFLLARVTGLNASFAVFALFTSFADVFYWTTYHALFATLGDAQHRGKQLGVRQALSLMANIFAPLIGGFTLDHWGPMAAFGMAAGAEVLGALPLLTLPRLPIARRAPKGIFAAALKTGVLFSTDGWISTGLVWAWGLLVFNTAQHSFGAFGAVIAIGALVSALGNLLLGRVLDAKHAPWVVFVNAGVVTLALVLRASLGHSMGSAYAIAATSSMLDVFYAPTLMTAFYNIVKHSACPFRFAFVTEGAWDIAGTLASLAAIGLLALHLPQGWTVALGFAAVPLQSWILYKYYRNAGDKTETQPS